MSKQRPRTADKLYGVGWMSEALSDINLHVGLNDGYRDDYVIWH